MPDPYRPGSMQAPVAVGPAILEHESTRHAFLTTTLAGVAAATVALHTPATSFAASGRLRYTAAAVPPSDAEILNFALTLEHLEAAFYRIAVQRVPFGADNYARRLAKILFFDEKSHVRTLTAGIRKLGYTPVGPAAGYRFGDAFTSMAAWLRFSARLEDTGVHAYLGQAPHIKTPAVLLGASVILTVEARHAGALRALLQQNPTDGAFDKGYTKQQVLQIVSPLIRSK